MNVSLNYYYKISLNHHKKTYTIKIYNDGKIMRKYRSYPQGKDFSEDWTQNDIRDFLTHTDEYFLVKDYTL